MAETTSQGTILIVDDEWESPIVQSVRRKLESEGWRVRTPEVEGRFQAGDEFEVATLYAIDEELPDGIVLDVNFGEHRDDRFKGLDILKKVVARHPKLPVLVFTQYAHGPQRDTAVRGSLRWDAPVDFIDKLASPDEVALRLRRLIGRTPQNISIGPHIEVDLSAQLVYVNSDGDRLAVHQIQGMRFDILRELALTMYRSPGELVPFTKLERYSEGEDSRASLRVRVREIKDTLGQALGRRFGASDLIINVRDQGYRLVPPKL